MRVCEKLQAGSHEEHECLIFMICKLTKKFTTQLVILTDSPQKFSKNIYPKFCGLNFVIWDGDWD